MRAAAGNRMGQELFMIARRFMRKCKQTISGFFSSPSHSRICFARQARVR